MPNTMPGLGRIGLDASRAVAVSTVLAVGGLDVADPCRRVARRLGASISVAELATVTAVAKRCRPLVVVISEDVFAFEPIGLSQLVLDLRATLVRIPSDGIDERSLLLAVARGIASAAVRRAT